MSGISDRIRAPVMLRHDLDRYALYAATAVFTTLAFGFFANRLDIPGGTLTLALFPALLPLLAARADRILAAELRFGALWAGLLLLAFWVSPLITTQPFVALGLPAAAGAAALIARFPALALAFTLTLTGALGTIQAFTGFVPNSLVDLMLAGAIVLFVVRVVAGRPYSYVVGPAILLTLAYAVISLIDLALANEFSVAFFGFRTTVWYMLAVPLVAYAGFSDVGYRRIALGFVGVTAALAGYAVLRSVIGPSGAEATLAKTTAAGINVDPITKELRTVGSFQTTHQLSFWMGMMAPFCAGFALLARGRTRRLAWLAVVACVGASVASHARGPLVGAAVGLGVVLLLYQFARAFRGFKLIAVAAAVAALAIVGTAGIVLGSSNPDQLDRYAGIFHPSEDPTFAQRQLKWSQIWPDVETHPLGNGLGSAGQGQSIAGRFVSDTTFNLDNSYLKIAYEQGLAVMALFAIAMLGLLGTLCATALRSPSRERAALAAAAAGTLASMLVSFYTGLYIESVPVLAGWLVIGLGLAGIVGRPRRPALAPIPGAVRPLRDA